MSNHKKQKKQNIYSAKGKKVQIACVWVFFVFVTCSFSWCFVRELGVEIRDNETLASISTSKQGVVPLYEGKQV